MSLVDRVDYRGSSTTRWRDAIWFTRRRRWRSLARACLRRRTRELIERSGRLIAVPTADRLFLRRRRASGWGVRGARARAYGDRSLVFARRSRASSSTSECSPRALSSPPSCFARASGSASATRRSRALRGVDEVEVRTLREQRERPRGVRARGHLRGRVRRANAVPLLDLRVRERSRRERPQEGDHPRRRPEPDRSGHRVRLLLLPRGLRAARARARDGDGQLQPGDGVDRLRHLRPPVLRAAHARGRARRSAARKRRRASSWA